MEKYFKDLIRNVCDVESEISVIQHDSIMDIRVFLQTWSSTALGFGGIGGSAMTTAFTTVILCKDSKSYTKSYVFFGGHLAYVVEDINDPFMADLEHCCMKNVEDAKKYYHI